MIYEYAIDPEFILEILNEKQTLLSLIREIKQGRILFSDYPEKFGVSAFQTLKKRYLECTDVKQKANIEKKQAFLAELKTAFNQFVHVKRQNTSFWNNSFCDEHKRFPFHEILSCSTEEGLECKNINWLKEHNCSLFNHTQSQEVVRSAKSLCLALEPLLANASEITIVDPYFFTENRYANVYKEFFRILNSASSIRVDNAELPRTVTIICSRGSKSKASTPYERFKLSCEQTYLQDLPSSIRVEIYRIEGDSQDVHDRYILTDIGGIQSGNSFEESKSKTSTTTLALLSKETLASLKIKYKPNSNFFDWNEDSIILSRSTPT